MSSNATKLLGFVFVAAAALSAPACADTDSAIFIRQVQLRDAEDSCSVTNDPSQDIVLTGLMDVTLTNQYRAVLLIGNQLIPRGDNTTLRPETSRVHLYEAEVLLFDFQGGEVAAYTQPLTGFIDPTSNTAPGYGFAEVLVVDPSATASINAGETIIARIKVFGRTLGGIEVETDYWDFPIETCSGCLAGKNCQTAQNCDAECVTLCNPGQDLGVDCRATPSHNPCINEEHTECVLPL